MKTSACKGCGKPIVWGVTPDGKRIPLDPRPAIYLVFQSQDLKTTVAKREIGTIDADEDHAPDGRYMVTHFATCPKASEF